MQPDLALARLGRMTQSTVDPGLTTAELQDLLAWSATVDANGVAPFQVVSSSDGAMTASSPLLTAPGAGFVSTDVGGLVTVAGAGASTLPGAYLSGTIQSVSGGVATLTSPAVTTVAAAVVQFSRPDPTWLPTYDMSWAAAEGWRWKAGKVSNRYNMGSDGSTLRRDQWFTHCMAMADHYVEKVRQRPYSVRLQGNLVTDRLGYASTVPYWYESAAN